MTQLITIDRATLEQLVVALEDVGTLTKYDWHHSSIWKRYYASAAGDFVDLRQLRDKTVPVIAALRAALANAEPKKAEKVKKREPTIDLGKYAGTYGGYITKGTP